MRYFLSVIGVVITFLLLCFCGGNGWEYLASMADVISMLSILLIVIPILISSGLHRDFIHAFPLALGKAEGKSLRQLKRAKEAVDLAIKAVVGSGLLSFFVGVIEVVNTSLAGKAVLANLGVCAIGLLYAAFFFLLLIPIQSKLKIKMMEYMEG